MRLISYRNEVRSVAKSQTSQVCFACHSKYVALHTNSNQSQESRLCPCATVEKVNAAAVTTDVSGGGGGGGGKKTQAGGRSRAHSLPMTNAERELDRERRKWGKWQRAVSTVRALPDRAEWLL